MRTSTRALVEAYSRRFRLPDDVVTRAMEVPVPGVGVGEVWNVKYWLST